MMKVQPRNDYVLLTLPRQEEQTTKGGIVLPTMAITAGPSVQSVGVISAVGPNCKDLKKGMKIIYPLHAGLKHMEEGKEYVFLRDNEIIAVVE